MGEEPGKGTVTQSAHGLDMVIILNLSKEGFLTNATRETQNTTKPKPLTNHELEKIGEDAAKKLNNISLV